jgi:hypothetical protein
MVLSDSIGRRTKDVLDIATGNKWYLAAFGIALSLIFIFGAESISKRFFVNASAGNYAKQNASTIPTLSSVKPPIESSAANSDIPDNSGSSKSTDSDATGDVSSKANVNVDGISIEASTNSASPDRSISKTVKTANGSADISIEQHSGVDQAGQKNSTSSVRVNNSSTATSNTSVFVNQSNSGGGSN